MDHFAEEELFTRPQFADVAEHYRSTREVESGLASGINNTARQAGTALGVAIYGAIAASPTHPGHFISALRDLGIAAAVLWIAAASLSSVTTRT